MSESTAPYEGKHRKSRKRSKRVFALSTLAMMFALTGTAAFAIPQKAQGDTPKPQVASLCGPDCERALFNRASRSDTRLTQPPPLIATEVAKIARKSAPKKEWYNPLPGYLSYCNYWQDRGSYNHRGEDISAPYGTPIHAVHAGWVKTEWDSGGGNMTIITHDGMAEVYMHQSSYKVRSGHVNAGQVIGYVGMTGDAQGYHLHLEIQPNGPWKGVTSPDKWLQARGVHIGC